MKCVMSRFPVRSVCLHAKRLQRIIINMSLGSRLAVPCYSCLHFSRQYIFIVPLINNCKAGRKWLMIGVTLPLASNMNNLWSTMTCLPHVKSVGPYVKVETCIMWSGFTAYVFHWNIKCVCDILMLIWTLKATASTVSITSLSSTWEKTFHALIWQQLPVGSKPCPAGHNQYYFFLIGFSFDCSSLGSSRLLGQFL